MGKILGDIRRNIRWLLHKRLRDRKLLFTRDNICIDRDIDYGDDEIVAYIETWFDTERKFGLWLPGDDYINVYAQLFPKTGDLRVIYIMQYSDGLCYDVRTFTALTQGERDLIHEIMDEVSLRETGKTVTENWLNDLSADNNECPHDITYYSKVSSRAFAKDLQDALGIEITERQSEILINYMVGSGYSLGISKSNVYRLDVNEEDGENERYSIQEAITVILEWMEDFSQEAGETSMDDYTLADMDNESSFNSWRGGIFGSCAEREKTRDYLRQLKLDEMELQAIAARLEAVT